ncbi:polysaccharide lyase family 7 protein [Pseudonocardia yunnanensis]|uniref:Polysaccharide lyase family 7 protein n=1 Tax=Pseudonocardia yunnanensis TaxID=58107 RepID=A0ABW4ESH8_9PSEU
MRAHSKQRSVPASRPGRAQASEKVFMRRILPMTAALALLLIATACGGPSAPSPPPSTTSAPAPPEPGGTPKPSAQYPADLIDLSNWYLTLPTGDDGDPDLVHQPELATYSGPAFHLDDAKDGVVFSADAGGSTTKGSEYPRSELREMSGQDMASWSNTSGTHTLTVREAFTRLPPNKPQVVGAQIHDAKNDVVLIRLNGERLVAEYGRDSTRITIDPAYKLGTPYDLRITAADSHIQIFYNGNLAADIPMSGSGWYFKAGAYVLSNPDKGDSPDAEGQVVIYSLHVQHTM